MFTSKVCLMMKMISIEELYYKLIRYVVRID